MKYKKLVKLGIISGVIAVGALIAVNRPEVKQMTQSFLSRFAETADTEQSIHVSAQDIANATPLAPILDNNVPEKEDSQADKSSQSTGKIKSTISDIFNDMKNPEKKTGSEEVVSPYQDAHSKFETGEISRVPESAVQVTVKRVVDGDTYLVDMGGKETKIRLIGVDTPESVASDEYLDKSGKKNTDFGKEVSSVMKEKLPEGTTLFVVTDVQEMDTYGRVLAYVYFEDGELVQDFLLSNGYAQVMTVPPNVAMVDHFLELEQKAIDAGVGIWQDYANAFQQDQDAEQDLEMD